MFHISPGFPPEPELRFALKDRDVFEDPPFSSSAASPSLITLPSEPTSPIIAVFGSGSSMVTTVMNEHPPTLPPAFTKPQVTPAKPVCLLKAVWGKHSENGPHYCHYAATTLVAHLPNDTLYSVNLKELLVKGIVQPTRPAACPVTPLCMLSVI